MRRLTVLLLFLVSQGATGAEIPELFRAVSGYTEVPAVVLYAVALSETGYGSGAERAPHPWAINVAGKGAYFDSREQLFEALMAELPNTSRVDVSYMQINWHWYNERLIDPWLATDPAFNLKTGAQILREHFLLLGDWRLATARYHSTVSERAELYAQRVWENVSEICSAAHSFELDSETCEALL